MEQPADLGLLQQLEQLVERDGRIVLDQAERGQRTGRFVRVADFRVDQFAGAEQLALAHDHAHEQCARRLRQGGEGGEESALVGGQQVAVALGDPREYPVEVIQVVELVVQNCDHCGGHDCIYIQYIAPVHACTVNSRRPDPRVWPAPLLCGCAAYFFADLAAGLSAPAAGGCSTSAAALAICSSTATTACLVALVTCS